jgi:hypothetical protein
MWAKGSVKGPWLIVLTDSAFDARFGAAHLQIDMGFVPNVVQFKIRTGTRTPRKGAWKRRLKRDLERRLQE